VRAAQVEHAVPQPRLVAHAHGQALIGSSVGRVSSVSRRPRERGGVGLVLLQQRGVLARQRGHGRQQAQERDAHLDGAGRELLVERPRRPVLHDALDPHDALGAQLGGGVHERRVRHDELHDARVVAQRHEHEVLARRAHAAHPAPQPHAPLVLLAPHLPAQVRALVRRRSVVRQAAGAFVDVVVVVVVGRGGGGAAAGALLDGRRGAGDGGGIAGERPRCRRGPGSGARLLRHEARDPACRREWRASHATGQQAEHGNGACGGAMASE